MGFILRIFALPVVDGRWSVVGEASIMVASLRLPWYTGRKGSRFGLPNRNRFNRNAGVVPKLTLTKTYKASSIQYTLRSLLLVFFVIALALAVCGWLGVIIGPLLVVLALFGRTGSTRTVRMMRSTSVLLLSIACLTIVLYAGKTRRSIENQALCQTKLKHIGMALATYRKTHAKLPPARQFYPEVKATYSWRAGNYEMYYDCGAGGRLFSWGVIVQRYVPEAPWEWRCPADKLAREQSTYLAVLERKGQWLPATNQFLNPVRVIEACHKPVPWTQPEDTTLEAIMDSALTKKPVLASHHMQNPTSFYYEQAGANALFCDGSVKQIPANLPTETLRAVLLGDVNAQAQLMAYRALYSRLNWPNCLALSMLLVCMATILFWPRTTEIPNAEGAADE
jgi:prepilin-type processing-associated H-X9-DG protein